MDFSEAFTDRCSSVGHASRSGDLKSLRKLIKQGYSVDVPDNRGWMPIHEAAFSNSSQCLQLLINAAKSESYIHSKTFEGETALHLAAKRGSVPCSELLLRAGVNPNEATNDLRTPLFLAVEGGSVDVVKLLLKWKVNVGGVHCCSGWNPLHKASYMERTDIIQLLLENGVDKECEDDFGITPLFVAAQYGKFRSLSMLCDCADVNCQARDKATPLFIAAQEGHAECAELLLSKGARPNLYCNDDAWQLPIHAAAQMGQSKILEMLMAVTDRVCDTGRDQVSPVYSAVYGEHAECLEMLLAGGYSPEAQECPRFDCKTPMCMVIQNGRIDLAQLLLKHGCRLSGYYLKKCLHLIQYALFRYLLTQGCPLPSGKEIKTFKKRFVKNLRKEWLLELLLAGLDPTCLLDAVWIRSIDDDILNWTLEFSDWKRLPADVEMILSTHSQHFTWIPQKHFASIPSLMHLCRLKIRSLLATERLRSSQYIDQLPLPVGLQEYLQYSEVLQTYGLVRKDDSD